MYRQTNNRMWWRSGDTCWGAAAILAVSTVVHFDINQALASDFAPNSANTTQQRRLSGAFAKEQAVVAAAKAVVQRKEGAAQEESSVWKVTVRAVKTGKEEEEKMLEDTLLMVRTVREGDDADAIRANTIQQNHATLRDFQNELGGDWKLVLIKQDKEFLFFTRIEKLPTDADTFRKFR